MRLALLFVCTAAACGDNLAHYPDAPSDSDVRLARAFRTESLPGCAYASPVLVEAGGETRALVVTSQGWVAAYTLDGEQRWAFELEAPGDEAAELAATPVAVGHRAVIAWQNRGADSQSRSSHHAAVVDVATGTLDPEFPELTFAASQPGNDGEVMFRATNAYSRSTIVLGKRPGDELGLAYVGFGNLRDEQPWHGWLFELDLDAWRSGGTAAAFSSVLLVTPEASCGNLPTFDGGCGGGIWAPSGPHVIQRPDGFELWVPTGNGQLDVSRRDYANSILRVGPGLAFDPHCDPVACATFDPRAPAEACMASCRDMFMPRLRAGDPPLAPQNGRCDGLTFLECYAELDLDLGADSPAPVTLASGRTVVVLPAKDGAVYLFDADHFGTMLDRLQIREFCGDNGGNCDGYNWTGTMVTEPLITHVGDQPVALVPTFYYDRVNPGGVVALDIVESGAQVTLRERWSAPRRDDREAVQLFRQQTGRLVLLERDGVKYAALADPADKGGIGKLLLLRVDDGAIVFRADLDGPGQRYQAPARVGDRIMFTSCDDGYAVPAGPSHLEGWDLAP
ncbi:MAG TPA: hypothetical protein VM513_06430 [Kofleriaceae bacterium]|nr:hypothetical protein [Kofleriaceae bacterium]